MMYAEVSCHDLFWRIPKIEKHVELTYLADEEEITEECKAEIIDFLLNDLQSKYLGSKQYLGNCEGKVDYSEFKVFLDDDEYYRELAEDDPVNCEFAEA